ncbi:MAG: DUF3108 domain-containing protein [Paludibacter sp.]|nr:DUF3108 domain-containing protein [Paludibacter sp.]
MRKLVIVVLVCLSLFTSAKTTSKIEKAPFLSGERLTFRVAFSSALTGNLTAGKASLQVFDKKEIISDHSYFHVVAEGGTVGFVEFFFNIKEKFESYIDEESNLPLIFIRQTRENTYKKNDLVRFNHTELTAKSNKKKTKITADTRDVISAFYLARMQNISKMKENDSFNIPYFFDDTIADFRIVYVGKQKIKTHLGVFNCIVFKPQVITGRVFDQKYPITFWVSDDKNRLPVLIESKLAIGKVRIELMSYNGGEN